MPLDKSSNTEDRRAKLAELEELLPRLNISDAHKQAIECLIIRVKAANFEPYRMDE